MKELHVMRHAFGGVNYFSRMDINDNILEEISDKNKVIDYEGGWVKSSDMSRSQLEKIAKYHNIVIVIEEFDNSGKPVELKRINP